MESGDVVLDVAGIAATVGLADWHVPHLWNLAKFPFSDRLVPLYADHVSRLVAAIRGRSRKALILDLDNTVWGGVIGDDGLDGIKVAQGDAAGEAFLSVQRLALDLRQRGVVLAVSSKNDDEIARAPFERHPEMLLKLGHIAVFQANWSDKATNIQAIAKDLSLGLDSLVFVDDNPSSATWCASSCRRSPSRNCQTIPHYTHAPWRRGVFRGRDIFRGRHPSRRLLRRQCQPGGSGNQLRDIEAYLASLNMKIIFQPFNAKQGAHRATYQQIEPIQSDRSAIYRTRSGADGERRPGFYDASPAGRTCSGITA